MEKATNIPDLFEVECPPEKIQISLGKYQTYKLKYLVNKVTGVKSCKYVSCDWAKCSTYSKTVVLKLRSKNRKNTVYNPCVLWNYETGETFSMHGADEFMKISIEEHEFHYRTFITVYDYTITCNTLTKEELPQIKYPKEKELAVPFVADTGNLIWKIKSVDYENRKTYPDIYEDVKLTSINGVDMWMVKHRKGDDWWLLHKHNKVASSVTGVFVKKGFCIFGQIENDRYRFYRLQKGIDFKEVTLELTDKSIILDKEREIPFYKTRFYNEEVTGLTTDRNWFKTKSGKAYPVLSPENQGDIPEEIQLYVGDEDFVPCRSYRDWAYYNYPKGTVAGFVITNMFVNRKLKLYYALLQDLDTGVEIVVLSSKIIFKEGDTVYLTVIKNLYVDIIKEKVSDVLSHKAVVEPGYFAEVSEEEYNAFKQNKHSKEGSDTAEVPQVQPEPQQITEEPEPSLLEKKIPELVSYVKYLLHEVEGEVSLNVQKDADGNVRVSILNQ